MCPQLHLFDRSTFLLSKQWIGHLYVLKIQRQLGTVLKLQYPICLLSRIA